VRRRAIAASQVFQAEIDADRDDGGLYETNGRAWVYKPREEDVKKWFRARRVERDDGERTRWSHRGTREREEKRGVDE
jgi:hypothetical protein